MTNTHTHWTITRPRGSHSRIASCADVDCQEYRLGGKTVLNMSDPVHRGHAEFIRTLKMNCQERRVGDTMVEFIFAPGQECFTGRSNKHRVELERESVMKKDGQLLNPYQWVDEMNDTLYRIKGVRNG